MLRAIACAGKFRAASAGACVRGPLSNGNEDGARLRRIGSLPPWMTGRAATGYAVANSAIGAAP